MMKQERFLTGYLSNISLEDTQHLVQLQLLPPFDGQFLDPVASLEERLESGFDTCTFPSAELLLQPFGQFLQGGQLDQAECRGEIFDHVR